MNPEYGIKATSSGIDELAGNLGLAHAPRSANGESICLGLLKLGAILREECVIHGLQDIIAAEEVPILGYRDEEARK